MGETMRSKFGEWSESYLKPLEEGNLVWKFLLYTQLFESSIPFQHIVLTLRHKQVFLPLLSKISLGDKNHLATAPVPLPTQLITPKTLYIKPVSGPYNMTLFS
jgi:hypothetical protein